MSEFYFGKISKSFSDQLVHGYYKADKNSSWFNGLQIDDYVLMVGGGKVQFWRAKKYNTDRMEFEIIIDDCGIKPQKLASLVYFRLDMELIVKSMRSTAKEEKAFFKIQPLPQFSNLVNLLRNKKTYQDGANFRKIVLYSDISESQKDTNNRDIHLYYENNVIRIGKNDFIDNKIIDNFDGDLKSKNFADSSNKNKIRDKFDLNGAKTKIIDISMRDFYDVFVSEQTSNSKNVSKKNFDEDDEARKAPLNLILYGPPGTGKTYNTLFRALEIIEGKTQGMLEDEKKKQDEIWEKDTNNPKKERKGYDVLKERYEKYVESRQIMFTTFHQSMSYEDFVEGIKPIPPQNNEEQMVYDVEDGIFKQICEKAKKISVGNKSKEIDFSKTRIFKMSLGEKGKDADYVFDYCVENEVIALGWGGSKDFTNCKTRADFQKLDSSWGAAALEIFKEWMKLGDIVLISDGTKEIKGIAQVDGNYEFRDDPSIDMHQFRKVKWLYTGDNIPISKLYDKNLSQQSIYGFYKENKKTGIINNGGIKVDVLNEIITGKINEKKQGNYVLIIDEINRGNVAQIFGELITLIEPSKRLGNDEEMKAILPYSSAQKGEPVYFGVPNNLYIIGTMNTADRSVEALDTALRRRFSFEEMMPDKSLLTGKTVCGVDLGLLLETINKRIVALKDREHQIGHSYFMDDCLNGSDEGAKEKWLANVFKDKIIPLLQEYFYGDYKKIYYVLGPGFVEDSYAGTKEDSIRKKLFPFVDSNDQELDISEEKYEIRPFDDDPQNKKDNKVIVNAAVNKLVNSEKYREYEVEFKAEKYTEEGNENEIDVKYVIERIFNGEQKDKFKPVEKKTENPK